MHQLSDVKPEEEPIPVHVRVLKKWKTKVIDQSKEQTLAEDLCYLFVDSHGDAIEAVAHPKKEASLNSKMKIGSCYNIDGYVAIKARKYMRVVPHDASLRLGNTTTFDPIQDDNIPCYYYNFATYDMLAGRYEYPKPLTDYIGRVETVSPPLIKGGKRVKKVKLQDEWENVIEITFWSDAMFPYEEKTAVGQVLAVTATVVTKYLENLQLESTNATTAVLNPTIPDLQTYIHKYSYLPKSEIVGPSQPILPIAEIKAKYKEDATQTRFKCKASITEITPERRWYYVTCPKCKLRLHLQRAVTRFVCEDDGYIPQPVFMYCVNTTITDQSGDAKAVFFNEAMEQMLGKSCYNMVVSDGYTDPEIVPGDIYKLREKPPATLYISMKQNETMAVNRAMLEPSIHPETPNPKPTMPKRKLETPPDDTSAGKHKK